MNIKSGIFLFIFVLVSYVSEGQQKVEEMEGTNKKIEYSEVEWKNILTTEQYNVCRLGATEAPGSGKYDKFFSPGHYECVACGTRLFDSNTKFDSGTGWPSFYDMHSKNNLTFQTDKSHGMVRTEVKCAVCDAHLGHLFADGPAPTGMRYCINSLALNFIPEEE